jgi:hypothetical protein
VPTPLDRLTADRAALFDELILWLARTPSFGVHSKRELELKVLELLYRDRLAELSVGTLAEELAVTRTRARSLLLELRTRIGSAPGARRREDVLAEVVKQWPRTGRLEEGGDRLRIVVDDPWVRDLLKNHAYARAIDLDTSFSSEIVTLTWPGYVALLRSLAGDRGVDDALEVFAAEIRRGLRRSSKEERAFRSLLAEPETGAARFARLARFAVAYGLPVVQALQGTLRLA